MPAATVRRFLPAAVLFAALLPAIVSAQRLVPVAGVQSGSAPGGAPLIVPFGIELDPGGNLVVVEFDGQRVHAVNPSGAVTTLAGKAKVGGDSGDGGPASAALFNGMHSLAVSPAGDIYLADTWNCRVRKIDARSGIVTTVTGTGRKGYSGDGGPATKADNAGAYSIALDRQGRMLYLADLHNLRVRRVDLETGVIQTVAGNGRKGLPDDGATAQEAPLVDPRAVAVDSKGNLYILERGGNALRLVDPSGKIRTVAGTGKKGAAGDGGPALEAEFNGPKHIAIDPRDDSVIIADAENHLVRRYDPATGLVTRLAGSGRRGSAGLGGDPLEAELARPHGVYVSPDGTLYIADSYNHRVLKIVD